MSVKSAIGQMIATSLDVVGVLFWAAGDLVSNFEDGRQGRLPRMITKEAREIIASIEAEKALEIKTEESAPKNPVGFH